MKKLVFLFFAIIGLVLSCEPKENPQDKFDVALVIPSTIDAYPSTEVVFQVIDSKAPLTSDVMVITPTEGGSPLSCTITKSSPEQISVKMSKKLVEGEYRIQIKRGLEEKTLGKAYFNIVQPVDPSEFTPKAESTVWGLVSCGSSGVAGVVVSDGVEVVATNEKGYYEFTSKKERNYVFISVPSGYEPEVNGVFPVIWKTCRSAASVQERLDFSLIKVTGQDNFTLLALGDMHLAGRGNSDLSQFGTFATDVKEYLSTSSKKTYGVTLGDMTWDIYWVPSCNYSFPQYKNTINPLLGGRIKIYHTIGNHDNDYQAVQSDWLAEKYYTEEISPNYYSYNIGKWHFVVLDDINCSNYDGTTSRKYYKDVTAGQLDWLAKDLSFVSEDTPVFLTSHAQYFYPNGTNGFTYDSNTTRKANTDYLLNNIIGTNRQCHIVTGHTHVCFNVTTSDSINSGRNVYEHNSGSVCGTWWWTGHYTGINMGPDGSPSGYQVFSFNGTNLSWQFKPTGKSIDYQFRSYDRNQMDLSTFRPAGADDNSYFVKRSKTWTGTSTANLVYINVWNWSNNWSIKVYDESNKELTVTRISEYDPLHLVGYLSYQTNGTGTTAFGTSSTNHFFRVTAPSADEDLRIVVTDEFGNTYTENMARPKAFSIAAYK